MIYEIRLQVKSIVYRYRAAGDCAVDVGAYVEPGREVILFMYRVLDAGDRRCDGVYPVRRFVPVTPESSGVVPGQQLFAGPTEAKVAQGYASPFFGATADTLAGIWVEGRTAFVDLTGVCLESIAGDACSRAAWPR